MRARRPASLAQPESLLDSLARGARRPERVRPPRPAVARGAGIEQPAPEVARLICPAADVVSWDRVPGDDVTPAPVDAREAVVFVAPESPAPAVPAPPGAAPDPMPAPEPPPPVAPAPSAAQGLPYIDAGVHRVHTLGDLVSDAEVERALETIRNPRLRTRPDRAVLDEFLDHLARDEPRAASVQPEPVSLPPAPPPPSPRELDLASIAGVAAVSNPASATPTPAPAPPADPGSAPPAVSPPAGVGATVFDIAGSVGRGAANAPDDVRAVKRRLIAIGFNWLGADDRVDDATLEAIRLFQAIKNRHYVVGPDDDGLIDVGDATHRWLQAVNTPRWQLLPAGSAAEGFENSERADTASQYDYGTDWLAATIAAAGAAYAREHRAANPSAALLTVNDASLPRGIPQPGETVLHKGHQTGLEVDLRLPRRDGTAGATTHADEPYDRGAMRAILRALRAQPLCRAALFNDPALVAEGLCTEHAGHDDHAHVQIHPPTMGPAESGRP